MKRLKANIHVSLRAGISATGMKSAIDEIAIGNCLRVDKTDDKDATWYDLFKLAGAVCTMVPVRCELICCA